MLHLFFAPAMILGLVLTFSHSAFAADGSDLAPSLVPARRDNPSKSEHGFLGFPIYSHIPGIGSNYGFGFLSSNIAESRMNLVGIGSTGDSNLAAIGLQEINLIEDRFVTSFYLYSTRIPFQVYERGAATGPDNAFFSTHREQGWSGQSDLYFWDRRIQLSAQIGTSRLQVESIKSIPGTPYFNRDNGFNDSLGSTLRAQLDLTDENGDPRKGLRLQIIRDETDIFDGNRSRFYALTGIATGYIPVGRATTLALNVLRSSAMMVSRNTLSEAELRQAMNLNCPSIADADARAACQATEDRRVNERFNENAFGTANLLGGSNHLRGFPYGRMRGAESVFLGAELRMNFNESNRMFDLGFMNGMLSMLQVAPFYELGAVTDPPRTIEQTPLRSSYGVGFRVGFSGMVIRADLGFSNEGSEATFFYGYPWDLPPF